VANVNFIFGTSPNTKPEEKKLGDMAYYIPPTCKSVGTRPPCPHQIAPMHGVLPLLCVQQWSTNVFIMIPISVVI